MVIAFSSDDNSTDFCRLTGIMNFTDVIIVRLLWSAFLRPSMAVTVVKVHPMCTFISRGLGQLFSHHGILPLCVGPSRN